MGTYSAQMSWLNQIDLVKLVIKGQEAIVAVCDASQMDGDKVARPWACTWVLRGQLETPGDVAHWLHANALYPENALHEAISWGCAT